MYNAASVPYPKCKLADRSDRHELKNALPFAGKDYRISCNVDRGSVGCFHCRLSS